MTVANALKLAWLPTELWFYILSFITDRNDLRHLCLASKVLFPESRRLLYRNVQLKGRMSIILWIETVLSSEIHATLVFSITLPTRASLSGYYERALAERLARLPNLVELNISHAMTSNSRDAYLVPKMLEGCSTFLKIFRNDLEDTKFNQTLFGSFGFYESHSFIENLYIANPTLHNILPHNEIPANILPQLNTLHIEHLELLQAFRAKPIRRLRIGRVNLTRRNIDQLIIGLMPFWNTLDSLCVGLYESVAVSRYDKALTVADFIEDLAGIHMPKLVHLCILADVTVERFDSEANSTRLLDSLRNLPNLITLTFGTSHPTRRQWGHSSNITSTTTAHLDSLSIISTPETTTAFAEKVFSVCEGLENVSFEWSSRSSCLGRSAFGKESLGFVRRSSEGVVLCCDDDDDRDECYWDFCA